ncbi:hypothetical protein ACFQU2_36030 [Siccirubricoccus deserti]
MTRTVCIAPAAVAKRHSGTGAPGAPKWITACPASAAGPSGVPCRAR